MRMKQYAKFYMKKGKRQHQDLHVDLSVRQRRTLWNHPV